MSNGTKRTTFWANLNPGEPKNHLRFIISDPDPDGSVMVVHATGYTGKRWQDKSCIIQPGDYSHITKASFIFYREADELTETELLSKSLKKIIIINKDKIPEKLLKKIQTGAQSSQDLPVRFNKYFKYF